MSGVLLFGMTHLQITTADGILFERKKSEHRHNEWVLLSKHRHQRKWSRKFFYVNNVAAKITVSSEFNIQTVAFSRKDYSKVTRLIKCKTRHPVTKADV